MDNKSLVELCVKITGTFEDGIPAYDTLAGTSDGMGMSAGILQWNAGSGTLQVLLTDIAATMTWPKMQTYFKSNIKQFASLQPAEAIQWCIQHYIQDGTTNVDPAAKVCWQAMLKQQASIDAQVAYATNTILHQAQALALRFFPNNASNTRVISFFFDLVTQSGGMSKVAPLAPGVVPSIVNALDYAQQHDLKCAGMWELAVQNDPLATQLLYYAYSRSLLSNPQYVWDTFSRRGSIACRTGIVHGATVNFSQLLD